VTRTTRGTHTDLQRLYPPHETMDQAEYLRGHPIFAGSESLDASLDNNGVLSLGSLKPQRGDYYGSSSKKSSGRRNIMALREYDLLLAVHNEIRITSLLDAKNKALHERSYKVCSVFLWL